MLKKIFMNDTFFLVMTVCRVLAGVANCILLSCISIMTFEYIASCILLIACTIVLYVSYKKHNKNVMKGMLGAALMATVFDSLLFLDYPPAYSIYSIIYFITSLVIFINHFVINSTSKSLPIHIAINQIAWIVMALNNTIWDISDLLASTSMLDTLLVINDLFFPCFMAVIVCVESRLDLYKAVREKN